MVARIATVAFQGVEVIDVDVQVQASNGLPAFLLVGLPDKAVAESRERVKAALEAIGLSLPPKRILVNLAPADLQKEGSHYDLPIALALLAELGVISHEDLGEVVALGELALDGRIARVAGVLPAALQAAAEGRNLICPAEQGPEAAWAQEIEIMAAPDLISLINHFKGSQLLLRPQAKLATEESQILDLADIKGQEAAKRALEVAAAGGHNLLMMGPPGSGKSMLAARLPGILPPLEPSEALEVTMIHSVAGALSEAELITTRPYRDPHHSASLPALVGGGMRAKPGEISLAHLGVLFLDELPEFSRQSLEALRQPLETGQVSIARANAHVTYPARVQMVAAMNPCRCGHLDDPQLACNRAPKCAVDYQSKISGPLFDRIDLVIEVPAVSAQDLSLPPPSEGSANVRERVMKARDLQRERLKGKGGRAKLRCNADLDGTLLEELARPEPQASALLREAAERFKLSARGYHRVLRVARTLADLEGTETISSAQLAEALSYRRMMTR